MRVSQTSFCSGWRSVLCAALIGLTQAGAACAQEPVAQPRSTVADELATLTGQAATAFVGQVVAITHRGGAVEIRFAVEQEVLGAAGASFTLREWAGLWPQGQSRYWVGERALVLLHGASAAGFTGPVRGSEGIIPVLVAGANAPERLDLRGLQASLLRKPGTPLPTGAAASMPLTEAVAILTAAKAAEARTPKPVVIERKPIAVAHAETAAGPTETSHAR